MGSIPGHTTGPAAPGPTGAHPTVPDELLRLAHARPDLAWRPGTDIAFARNAHVTNTRAELAAALRSDANFLEGDVRPRPDGTPEMRHDKEGQADLSLREWLAVAGASGRGVKVEIKDASSLTAVLDDLAHSGIPDERLIINVSLLRADRLQQIRRAHPRAIINLSPPSHHTYSAATVLRMQLAARSVGGNVMFPLRLDLVDQGVVQALKPYGRVAIWNSPQLRNPSAHDEARMRAMGVDGMIDLLEPQGLREHLESGGLRIAGLLLGWDRVLGMLDGAGLLD